MIFLSCGFSESQDSQGELSGMARVRRVCESLREKTPEQILARLTEAVGEHGCGQLQQDDRTAAILRY